MKETGFDTIGVQRLGPLLEITLQRPGRLNAINAAMRHELSAALTAAASDPDIRVLLLTGAGRAFSAGQDLGERAPLPEGRKYDLGLALDREYNPLLRQIGALEKPVVCAVNGVAAGAGVGLALAADVVFAACSARFILSFTNIGLGPDCGVSWLLPRLVGAQRAAAMAMSGEPVGARKAEDWGMIWQALPDAELLVAARKFAALLASKSPLGLAATRKLLQASWRNSYGKQLSLERDSQQRLGCSEDYSEGVAAFQARRPPSFRGC